jgi:two-component system CAI-1 autoinducer sensor kinase/phosphatase CqsS
MNLQHLFKQDFREQTKINRIAMLGWVALIGYPLYFLIWAYAFPQQYENLPLRIIGMVLAIPAIFARKLHKKPWFGAYQVTAVTYALPFYFTFMLLMNAGSNVWSQSMLIATLVLFHFRLRIACASFVIGCLSAYLCYVISQGHQYEISINIFENIPILLFSVLLVLVVKIGNTVLIEEKLRGMASALGVIAHELRTPLVSIDASSRGINRYLPALVEFYKQYQSEVKPNVLPMGREHMMIDAVNRIQSEVYFMNNSIDMLLANAADTRQKAQQTQNFEIAKLLDKAILRYPFENEKQRQLLTATVRSNFMVQCNDELFMMVVFNLLKNSLRAIAKASKGDISIVAETNNNEDKLIFRDTGCGIPAKNLPLIFRRFYTFPTGLGSGIGLTFVQEKLRAWGCKIQVISKEDEFTEFTIVFPKSNHAKS